MLKRGFAILAVLAVTAAPAFASMTLRQFRKLKPEDQTTYVMAAVSMLAYTYAAEGNPARGRCIQNWYYGEPGKPTPGPRAITVELAVAEERDPDKYTAEGVILGLTDQVCDQPKPSTGPAK